MINGNQTKGTVIDMACVNEQCDFFPFYGVAPHEHKVKDWRNLSANPAMWFNSTKVLSKKEWPESFVEDKDSPGCGTYYCPNCLKGIND